MKKFFRTIHLYLGLAAGIVISITCFTGSVLVFEKELQHSIYPERYKVEKQDSSVALTRLAEKLHEQIPGAAITSMKVYSDPERSVELSYIEPAKDEKKE